MARRDVRTMLLGAAFLMATSAIGPGFLTQTALFTGQLGAAFAFAIAASVALDVVVQINVWRIVGVSGLPAQEIARRVLPGLGHVLAGAVVFGGLVFNVGNVAGCALGLEALAGVPLRAGALVSAAIALAVFLGPDTGRALDRFSVALGVVMLGLTTYVAARTHPPLALAAREAVWPSRIEPLTVLTLVGGTVGGYISFAGAHRLVASGLRGSAHLPAIDRGAVQGIAVTGLMRTLLFLAVLGVVAAGGVLDPANPPASAFALGAGALGKRLFGVVLWAAAITSVVGASYTSISFLETLSASIGAHRRAAIAAFIVVSTAFFLVAGRPVALLVAAGAVNGLVLPLALVALLAATRRADVVGDYRHPRLLLALGLAAAAGTVALGWLALRPLADLWR